MSTDSNSKYSRHMAKNICLRLLPVFTLFMAVMAHLCGAVSADNISYVLDEDRDAYGQNVYRGSFSDASGLRYNIDYYPNYGGDEMGDGEGYLISSGICRIEFPDDGVSLCGRLFWDAYGIGHLVSNGSVGPYYYGPFPGDLLSDGGVWVVNGKLAQGDGSIWTLVRQRGSVSHVQILANTASVQRLAFAGRYNSYEAKAVAVMHGAAQAELYQILGNTIKYSLVSSDYVGWLSQYGYVYQIWDPDGIVGKNIDADIESSPIGVFHYPAYAYAFSYDVYGNPNPGYGPFPGAELAMLNAPTNRIEAGKWYQTRVSGSHPGSVPSTLFANRPQEVDVQVENLNGYSWQHRLQAGGSVSIRVRLYDADTYAFIGETLAAVNAEGHAKFLIKPFASGKTIFVAWGLDDTGLLDPYDVNRAIVIDEAPVLANPVYPCPPEYYSLWNAWHSMVYADVARWIPEYRRKCAIVDDPSEQPAISLPVDPGICACPLPIAQVTPLTSRVENPQLSHIHTATDYQSAGGASGCGSCGAGVSSSGGLTTDIRLDRIHRYADFTRAGSFGPGVFSNLDIQLTLWNHGEAGEIWDPAAASPIPLTPGGTGLLADQKRSAIKGVRLLAADGATLVEADAAVTAIADLHDGGSWVFELVQAGLGGDADRQGRLIAIRDRSGNQVSIAYAFPASATDAVLGARSRLLEMASASDQRGRTLSFAYGWTCGQPVITTLTYPTGAKVVYHYDGDLAGVSAIDYPDGTHSSFTTHLDAATQTQVIDYQDAGAEGVHRTKSVHLTLADWQNADGTRTPQSPNRVRRVVGPTGEPTYLNWLERDGAQVKIYVFEGGGIGGAGRMLRLDTTEGVTDTTWIASQWSFATAPSTWTWEKVADYQADSRFRMGAQTDPLGKSTVYERDPASGAITAREHRDASGGVLSRETTAYNAMRLPTRHQDANGLITRSEYDGQGNLLRRIEGIVMAADGKTEDLSTSVVTQWSYRADGQVETETDALGRVTHHEYDARGFHVAEISPPDDPAKPLARARKEWHYDAAGRLDWSKDAAVSTHPNLPEVSEPELSRIGFTNVGVAA